MAGYETRTSQFGIVSGIRQPISDLVTVIEPGSLFAPEARKGRLYLVVEADQEVARSLAACQLVAQTVRKVFYADSSYSVTSALRAAIREANKLLYQQNLNAASNQRIQVGITCAVIKGADLFIAQVAPTQAYVWTDGALRALPAPPAWNTAHLSATPFTRSGAIGSSLFIEPEFYRCLLRPGDALALCSSNFAPLLEREHAERTLHYQDPTAAVESLYTLCRQQGIREAHSIIVEVLPPLSPAARNAPLSPRGVSERGRLVARVIGSWFAGLTGEAVLTMRGKPARKPEAGAPDELAAPRPDPLKTMPPEVDLSPNPPPKIRPLDMGEDLEQWEERERRERQPARREPALTPPSAFLGEGGYLEAPPQRRIDLSDTPTLAATMRPYRPRRQVRPLIDLTWGERMALPFQRLGEALDDLPRRVRARRVAPPPMPAVRGQGLSYRHQKPPFPWLFLFIISLLVTILILYGINFSRRSAQQQALDYVALAEERVADVRAASDDATALERLETARRAIDEVRASPQVTVTNATIWLRFQELQRDYERLLASVQRVTFFDNPTILATHSLPNGRFASVIVPRASAAVTDTTALDALRYIYALGSDKENARLYRIPLDGGAPQPYLSPDEVVQSTVVGQLRGQTWRVDNIIAIDQGNNGFGYYFRSGNAWNYSRLGGTELWSPRGRIDLETYDGNLYVWGATPGEILKFNSGRYSDPPLPWIDPNGLDGRDLSMSVDMAVDGNIYLLQPDGRVLVFSVGRLSGEITPEGITPPITAVTRFFVTGATPQEGWFFLLDTLNERIIQVEKTSGKVIQQIQMRPDSELRLNELSDIYVDDAGSRPMLYLVNGGTMLRVGLPAPPNPFRQPTPPPVNQP